MGEKDGCKGWGEGGGLEAATVCYILCLFGQGKFIFIREKSGTEVCTLMSVATMIDA